GHGQTCGLTLLSFGPRRKHRSRLALSMSGLRTRILSVPCVYVLRSGDDNLFKIGRATDLEKRMKHLATGNPHPLTPYAVIETEHPAACEAFMHHLVQSRRSTRSDAQEFFHLDPGELDALVQAAQSFVADFLPMKSEAEQLA